MPDFDFDLFVIGGGSGGVRAARVAAEAGARVGLAEEYRYGGTCVIRGCVPKKLMVYAASFADAFEDAHGYGWAVEPPRFDWTKLIAAKDAEISRLEAVYHDGLRRAGVRLCSARATVLDAFSLNYRITLAEEGCFDRSQASHAINLCDMNAKYADVVKTAEVLEFFDSLPANQFNLPSGAPHAGPPGKHAG